MRLRLPILLSIAAIGASALVAGAAGGRRVVGSSNAPVVPLSVQRAIRDRAPQLAYIPTTLPASPRYRYATWTYESGRLFVLFRRPDRPAAEIDFSVARQSGSCSDSSPPAPELHLDQLTVYFETDYGGQRKMAWRCERDRQGRQIMIAADGPFSGVSPLGLARMVAFAKPIG